MKCILNLPKCHDFVNATIVNDTLRNYTNTLMSLRNEWRIELKCYDYKYIFFFIFILQMITYRINSINK